MRRPNHLWPTPWVQTVVILAWAPIGARRNSPIVDAHPDHTIAKRMLYDISVGGLAHPSIIKNYVMLALFISPSWCADERTCSTTSNIRANILKPQLCHLE